MFAAAPCCVDLVTFMK